MVDLLSSLNEKQREAAEATEGPVMVIAGAGSGKTRVLTHRIAYLIQEKGVKPQQILAVTFTNKAAEEMRTRIGDLLGVKVNTRFSNHLPVVGTFHSLCVQILRKEIHNLGYENSFLIYDDVDQASLIKKIMVDLNLDKENGRYNPKAFAGMISDAKSKLIEADEYGVHSFNSRQREVAEVYLKYERIMRQRSVLDFDDLIFLTVKLFKKFPEVLDKYQERFKYISVDEYQDTNQAQYILTKLLAEKYRNLCVIGDTDQSIYSWRGADYTNLLNFKKDYSEAVVVKLEQNYRSTKNILAIGNAVIAENERREVKVLWTQNEEGERAVVEVHETEQEEARRVVKLILNLVGEEGYKLKDCAVLYRLSAQSRALEEACLKEGVPYNLIGGVKFYSRKEIKDLLAYAKLSRYPQDDESFSRIVNVPARKLGPTSLAHLERFAMQEKLSLFEAVGYAEQIEALKPAARTALKKLAEDLAELATCGRTMPASGVLAFVCEQIGYRKFLLDGTEEGETRWENVQELLGVAKKYDALEMGVSLATFLEEAALFTSLDEADFEEDKLNLMTMHAAKGLEFPVVAIVGVEEGILPHTRSLFEPEQLEEERRLFYVAVTRAKKKLFLMRARKRLFYGGQFNPPSRFLKSLPEEAVSSDESATVEEWEQMERLRSWRGRFY